MRTIEDDIEFYTAARDNYLRHLREAPPDEEGYLKSLIAATMEVIDALANLRDVMDRKPS